MAGASVSEMILFIAALVVAASVAGTLTTQVDRVSESLDDRSLDLSQEIRVDVTVISDAGAQVHDRDGNGNVSLYVRNTGSSGLPANPETIDVFFDGSYQSAVNVTVVKPTNADGSWPRGGVIELSFSVGSLPDGSDHRVKLIVREDEELFEFRK
ncbi:MAG: putative archaeal flagellar protein G [halophilic archaeon J07HB67]|jgi:Putative archaeal flagellar protein G|nr:MAG: putative archaeal flagellar protein G [halophilic archaeon J07HB67]